MNIECSGGSIRFAKELRALEMRSIVTGLWKFTTTNREQSSKLILTTTREVTEQCLIDHPMVARHSKRIGKVKKFNKWVQHELNEHKKYHHFEA